MTKFFMYDSELQELEQLMMLVPNFVPRGSGMVVVHGFVKEDPLKAQVTLPNLINQVGVKSHARFLNRIEDVYDSIIANCFHECKFYRFRSRLEYLIRTCSGDFSQVQNTKQDLILSVDCKKFQLKTKVQSIWLFYCC
jgi:hypothetical protein